MATVYHSKIDAPVFAALVLGMVAAAFGVTHLAPGTPDAIRIGARVVAVLAIGLPPWLLLGTRYVLDAAALRVRCGPFRWTIALAAIRAVTPTNSPLSSPALSMDRLRIDYGQGRVLLISPRQRERFLRQLEALRSGPPRSLDRDQ